MNKRSQAHKKGHWAEFLAQLYFRFKGYKVLECRYKTKLGEIDLIVQKKKALVFVEVKLRRDIESALDSIRPQNKSRIERAALLYLSENVHFNDFEQRFDVFVIVMRGRFIPNGFRHLDNAWQLRS